VNCFEFPFFADRANVRVLYFQRYSLQKPKSLKKELKKFSYI
jgi:hypothetical protein